MVAKIGIALFSLMAVFILKKEALCPSETFVTTCKRHYHDKETHIMDYIKLLRFFVPFFSAIGLPVKELVLQVK
jgi:hypothetical protein